MQYAPGDQEERRNPEDSSLTIIGETRSFVK
jgi:hypothetical protein